MTAEYRREIETTEELAAWYDVKYTEMGDGWYTPPEECNRHLDDLGVPFDKTKTLLDVGCGAGHFLAEAQKRVTAMGMEISEQAIDYAKKRVPEPDLVVKIAIDDLPPYRLSDFDYIVSLGSLEHVIDLDGALDYIRNLLKPGGKFYFYCPNELWKHYDQPNERTMTDEEWIKLFALHGLYVHTKRRWNDNTAFVGTGAAPNSVVDLTPKIPQGDKLNCGSGQRPFARECGWINIDIQDKYSPDLVADWNDLSMFKDESTSLVVAHHTIEHVGCGEADKFIREAYRVLKAGGSLLVFVPDMRVLAQRWLTGYFDTQLYMTNVYGAYMGDENDRHRWGYDRQSLVGYLKTFPFNDVHAFNWREIPGADIARDWWIMGFECVK